MMGENQLKEMVVMDDYDGGKAQAYMKIIGIGGSDVALGSAKILTNTSLPVQSINFTKAQVRGALGINFVQDARIATWIDLYDKANNLTSGAVSLDTLSIDTIPPVKGSFSSGLALTPATPTTPPSTTTTTTLRTATATATTAKAGKL